MKLPEVWVLETRTGTTTLDQIQDTLEQAWHACSHVPDFIRMQVATAAAEIGANIIEHANPGGTVQMRMELRVLPHDVRIDFTDDGAPVAIDLDSIKLPEETAGRGRGLAMARIVLDRLTYHRTGKTNHWTLVRDSNA